MDINWGNLATQAAPYVGAGLNYAGQIQANATNMAIAQRQMEFQERMRNTQWQSAVDDMRAAGLNPALAYSQGPNAAPQGAGAHVENAASGAVSSAIAVKQMQEQLRLVREQVRGAKADADYKKAYNAAHGFTVRKDGSVYIDLSMPGIAQKVQSEISSARAMADLNNARVPEAKALASLFQGESGELLKGGQLVLPLMLSLIKGIR